MTSARPLQIIIIPSVWMKGGTLHFAIRKPLMRPTSVPTRMPSTTLSQIGSCMVVAKTAIMTPQSVIFVPTEMSQPPPIIT